MRVQLALYRECRPKTFSEIVGQEHVTRTLLNAIAQGRLAHGYLFCGPRGTGKTTTARILAKALNCRYQTANEPCGQCESCQGIARGEGVDVIEMDAASNRGVDEIRNLRERIRLAPVSGTHKVYVIDEVHMLTNEAFNALLKTLEEPPNNVVFVLCTTEAYRVPATILSRCQRFDFHRLPTAAIAEYLSRIAQERSWDASPAAIKAIARSAGGSMRDALGILDQCTAYSGGYVGLDEVRRVLGAVDPITFTELASNMLAGDLVRAWQALDDLLAQGRDAREVARGLAFHFRDVLLHRLSSGAGEPAGPLADDPAEIGRHAAMATEKGLYELIDSLAAAEAEMRLAPSPRLLLEARLVRACAANPSVSGSRSAQTADAAPPPRAPAAARSPTPPAAAQEPPAPPAAAQEPPLGPNAHAPREDYKPDWTARPQPLAERSKTPPASVDNTKGASDSSIEGPGLRAAWQRAMSQLSDKDRGLLDGAEPGWEGRFVCAWLPADRGAIAEHLNGRPVVAALAKSLGDYLGRDVEVRIRARAGGPGLFDAEMEVTAPAASPTAPGERGAQPSGVPLRSGSNQITTDAARIDNGPGQEDVIKEAQEMFRAQEVSKE